MTVRNDYELYGAGLCNRTFTKAVAVHAADSPTATQPFAIATVLAAGHITGTIITFEDATDLHFVGDVGPGQVYKHNVRNVKTYSGGDTEATFDEIAEGDQIYYDLDTGGTMPADVRLSTSPLAADGVANPRFGWAVLFDDSDTFPKGGATASTQEVAVMQSGAGGIV